MRDELPIAIWRSEDFGSGIESEHERNFVDLMYTLWSFRRRQPAFHRYSESIANRVTRQNAAFTRHARLLISKSGRT